MAPVPTVIARCLRPSDAAVLLQIVLSAEKTAEQSEGASDGPRHNLTRNIRRWLQMDAEVLESFYLTGVTIPDATFEAL
jgi:hypothetical protein